METTLRLESRCVKDSGVVVKCEVVLGARGLRLVENGSPGNHREGECSREIREGPQNTWTVGL